MRILFIASQHADHPRVKHILSSIGQNFEVAAISSRLPIYALRIPLVLARFFFAKRNSYDVVVIGFLPQPLMPVVAKLWQGRIVADVFYSLYDTVVSDRKLVQPKSFLARLCRRLDRFTLQRADRVITDTQSHGKYMAHEFGISEEKIFRVLIGAGDEFAEQPLAPISLKEGELFRVLFFGTFIPLQGVDVIIRAASILKDEHIQFMLVGDGQTHTAAKNLVRELALKNVEFLGRKSTAELRKVATHSHAILGIFGTSSKALRVIPHKAFEALALNRPLITARTAASEELLTDGRDVMFCSPGDPVDLAKKILWLRDNYSAGQVISNAGRETFMGRAASANIAEQLRLALKDVNRQQGPIELS